MTVKVIVPDPCDHPEPNINVFRRSIRVELRAVVGGLCAGPAKASHRIQRFELRQLKQGLCELVDLLCQFWYSTFFAAVMPSRPPSPAIIIGTGVDQLADRMLQVIKRKLLFGSIINVAETSGRCQSRPVTVEVQIPAHEDAYHSHIGSTCPHACRSGSSIPQFSHICTSA